MSTAIRLRVSDDVPFMVVPLHPRLNSEGETYYARGKVRSGEEFIHRGHPGAISKYCEVVDDPRTKAQIKADEAEWKEYKAACLKASAEGQPAPAPPRGVVVAAKKPGPKPKPGQEVAREDVPGQGPEAPAPLIEPPPGAPLST